MIGFGPTLWKTRKGETEYGVKAIPLGGYCAVVGMLPPYREGKNTWLKRFADSVRAADWQYITDEDVATGRLFYQQRYLKRLLIMAGGVLTNLVLAFLLFLSCNLIWGQYPEDPTLTVDQVVDCVQVSDTDTTCRPTPASAAGVQAGDTLTGLNGLAVSSYAAYKQVIEGTVTTDATGQLQAGELRLTVDRPGQGQITLPPVPGMIATFSDGSTGVFLGVNLRNERLPVGPWGTLKEMGQMSWMSIQAIAKLPYYAWTTLRDLVTGAPRDPQGVMSVVGAARVAGEVASTNQLDAGSKVMLYLYLLGSINLFVGLMNLVPLLPFDGGYVAAGLYGVLRSRWATIRRRPDPGPVDAAKLQPVAYVVAAFLILFGAVLIVADIVTPIRLF
jgi:membrane-associated protease RseP (regulator of RpoE activity)